ncbi:MAG: hypothetical protein ACK4WM_00680 [Thermoflexales bacterium]
MTRKRKGIYQHLDAAGNVIADERWQIIFTDDGSLIQLDDELVRVAPFAEPRGDSLSLLLNAERQIEELSIHGLHGARVCRVSFPDADRRSAVICWQHRMEVHEKSLAWGEDVELDWDSPLLKMVIVYRAHLEVGQSCQRRVWQLDALDFSPTLHTMELRRLANTQRTLGTDTVTLAHYQLGDAELWCDADGVIHELRSPMRVYRLTATNLPLAA